MKPICSDPKLCTHYALSWFPGLGGGMYDSWQWSDPKENTDGPPIMCCTKLVNSVTDYYKYGSVLFISSLFKSKQFQYWQ